MIVPPFLKSGDKVAIVAPARKINPADVSFASNVISSWGFSVVLGKNIFSPAHSYFSGSDEERLSDLQTMINNAEIRAIICARGGYGSTRILDALDLTPLKNDPKWIIGFSDITALHLKLMKHQIVSLHATMPILFSKTDSAFSVESLKIFLLSGSCQIKTSPTALNKSGSATGAVIGGNLSLVVDSLGTSTEPDTSGKILLLEEIDEYLYKIDRMMTQLRRAGKLKNLKGLIIGHMTDIKDSELRFGEGTEQIILNATKDYSYPVAFGFPSGHENPNYTWVHGAEATLSVSEQTVTLSYK